MPGRDLFKKWVRRESIGVRSWTWFSARHPPLTVQSLTLHMVTSTLPGMISEHKVRTKP